MEFNTSETEVCELLARCAFEIELKYQKGTLFKYARFVKNASEGCVTDAA